jgi:16S rRNA (guanine966-N2)-methyltransferase
MATRPTSAKVREALFSILGDITGARVLDLYAGSGALGIEALSRGAESAVFVEHDRAALACIRENLAELDAEARARVLPVRAARSASALDADVAARSETHQKGFDVVFCDPPWDDLDEALAALERLVSSALLREAARVVLEHSVRDAEPEVAGLAAYDRRRWGDTAASFFRAT